MSQRPFTPQTARDLAKWLIWPYVTRGDSIESLREGGMGYCGTQGVVEIHLDHIIVRAVGEPPRDSREWTVKAKFKLAELYREIQTETQTGVTQSSLFGAGESA